MNDRSWPHRTYSCDGSGNWVEVEPWPGGVMYRFGGPGFPVVREEVLTPEQAARLGEGIRNELDFGHILRANDLW